MISIKDMSMPDCCMECPFYSGVDHGTCLVKGWQGYFGSRMGEQEIGRQEWCPLVEIEESEDKDNE